MCPENLAEVHFILRFLGFDKHEAETDSGLDYPYKYSAFSCACPPWPYALSERGSRDGRSRPNSCPSPPLTVQNSSRLGSVPLLFLQCPWWVFVQISPADKDGLYQSLWGRGRTDSSGTVCPGFPSGRHTQTVFSKLCTKDAMLLL